MRNTERSLIALLVGMFLVASGCGSSSTESKVAEEKSTETATSAPVSSTVVCSQTALCVGTYSTNVVAGQGLLNGPCVVSHVDASDKVNVVFKKSDNCDFKSVTATGDTGNYWAALLSGLSYQKVIVHHKGVDVYLLRVFPD